MRRLFSLSITILMFLTLAACGGSGGDDPDLDPSGSSDWDTMKWDQDNWK